MVENRFFPSPINLSGRALIALATQETTLAKEALKIGIILTPLSGKSKPAGLPIDVRPAHVDSQSASPWHTHAFQKSGKVLSLQPDIIYGSRAKPGDSIILANEEEKRLTTSLAAALFGRLPRMKVLSLLHDSAKST